MVDGVRHLALAVSDVPRAVSFYEDVLGVEPVGPDDSDRMIETADYSWLRIGDEEWLNLARRPDGTPDQAGDPDDPHAAFRATEAEVRAVAERLAERDAALRESRTSVYFRDPDGTHLEATPWDGPSV